MATIGTFDGVHLGHQAILRELVARSQRIEGTSIVITFEPHPQVVIDPQTAPKLLTIREEKLNLLDEYGIRACVVLPFDIRFSQRSAEEFVGQVLVNGLNVEEVVIGYDHAFGKDRAGRLDKLRQLGRTFNFRTDVVHEVRSGGQTVSSTRIRKALQADEFPRAMEMLGHPYPLTGKVVRGEGRGQQLRFPTANLSIDPRKLLPCNGVYAITALMAGQMRQGVMNIGRRPTFGAGERSVEVYLFDFDEDLYGHVLQLHVYQKIRQERKFDTVTDLQKSIRRDEARTRALFRQKLDLTTKGE